MKHICKAQYLNIGPEVNCLDSVPSPITIFISIDKLMNHFNHIFLSVRWKYLLSFSHYIVSEYFGGFQPSRILSIWDFPGTNTGVCCQFLLQGIFPTQGSKPGLLHCRQILYRVSHQGSAPPSIL